MVLLMARADVLMSEDLVERGESLERSGCEGLWNVANDIRGQG